MLENTYSYREKIIAQVGNKNDEIALKAIQEYIAERKNKFDENIHAILIDEDKLRYILNLGIAEYNKIKFSKKVDDK